MSVHLFVYGTLMLHDNPLGRRLALSAEAIGKGTVEGILYDTGEYPALVPGSGLAHGMVYAFDDPELLSTLDEYEGVGPDEEQPNLYLRQTVKVTTDRKILSAWAYIYNRPVDALKVIARGHYLQHLAQKNPPGS